MTPRHGLIGIVLGSALLMAGCQHCCKRQPGPGPTGGPPGPFGASPNLAPQNIPLDPPPRTGMRPEILLPAKVPPSGSSPIPPAKGQVTLGEPDFDAPPAVDEKKQPTKAPPLPAITEESPVSPLPVGIAAFAQVKDEIGVGLRPDLEGLDWLRSKGYKTVLFLRSGKEDDSSDRKQVEMRGLKYQSLKIMPESINQALVTDFNRIVNDNDARPIFVYDLDGKRAGVMWYLYFRSSESLNDEEARAGAGRFGLKEKGDAEQMQLWTAVQKFNSENKP